MDSKTRDLVWGLGSAVAIVIGSLGPWATFGPFSKGGTDGDGVLTLILGIAAVAFIMANRWMVFVLILAVLSAAIGIFDTIDVSSAGNEFVSPSPGWGVILVAIAGVSLTAWAARNVRAKRRGSRPASAMPNGEVGPHRVDQP